MGEDGVGAGRISVALPGVETGLSVSSLLFFRLGQSEDVCFSLSASLWPVGLFSGQLLWQRCHPSTFAERSPLTQRPNGGSESFGGFAGPHPFCVCYARNACCNTIGSGCMPLRNCQVMITGVRCIVNIRKLERIKTILFLLWYFRSKGAYQVSISCLFIPSISGVFLRFPSISSRTVDL